MADANILLRKYGDDLFLVWYSLHTVGTCDRMKPSETEGGCKTVKNGGMEQTWICKLCMVPLYIRNIRWQSLKRNQNGENAFWESVEYQEGIFSELDCWNHGKGNTIWSSGLESSRCSVKVRSATGIGAAQGTHAAGIIRAAMHDRWITGISQVAVAVFSHYSLVVWLTWAEQNDIKYLTFLISG